MRLDLLSCKFDIFAVFVITLAKISMNISKLWTKKLFQPLNQEKVIFMEQKIFFFSEKSAISENENLGT